LAKAMLRSRKRGKVMGQDLSGQDLSAVCAHSVALGLDGSG
jgi:hypothetical protein